MTVDASTPLFAVTFLAWFMIVLPIVLLLIIAVMYLKRPRPSNAEVEQAHRASVENAPSPADQRKLPGG